MLNITPPPPPDELHKFYFNEDLMKDLGIHLLWNIQDETQASPVRNKR